MTRPFLSLLRLLTLLTLSALTFSAAAQTALEQNNFVRGLRIETISDAPVQSIVLPLEVYRGVQRRDLGDMRVFNSIGEEVPHSLISVAELEPIAPTLLRLPVYALFSEPQQTGLANILGLGTTPAEGEASTTTSEAADEPLRPNAYILDARDLAEPIRALTLTWDGTHDGFITGITVESSNNLETWDAWGTATVVRLADQGTVLERNIITLPQRNVDYIRVRWPTGVAIAGLQAVEATMVDTALTPEDLWLETALISDPQTRFEYRFDSGGYATVNKARLHLPTANTVASFRLMSANTPDSGNWTLRYEGTVYRTTGAGVEESSGPITFEATQDRYWRVSVEGRGGGLGAGTPGLDLSYVPQRLLFVPRGGGPFLLAFGAQNLQSSAFEPERLLNLLPEGAIIPEARAVEFVNLGGEEALVYRRSPWQRIAEQIGVAVVLLFIALMTLRNLQLQRRRRRERRALREQQRLERQKLEKERTGSAK